MQQIRYATATNHWDEWMLEYRYGALYIFPPNGVIQPVDELRKKYDPRSASYRQAHISLSEPLPKPLSASQISESKTALCKIQPFYAHYGPLVSFPPHPGVVYSIQPQDRFKELRSIVHSTSPFANVSLKRQDIAPHMTIAEFITLERTDELLRELRGTVQQGRFLCESIEYAVPNQGFYFERVFRIPIGQRESFAKARQS